MLSQLRLTSFSRNGTRQTKYSFQFQNKNGLFELMFAEDTIFDVVGCLEFDPSLTSPKRHREYLKSIATFHQVSHATLIAEQF